jgi:hypothetical protein
MEFSGIFKISYGDGKGIYGFENYIVWVFALI